MQRKLAGETVNGFGLGCMNLSHAYGVPPTPEAGREVLAKALDLGVDHFDTAALYGFGRNETLVGEALKGVRQRIFLASKCGLTNETGARVMDGRPETLRLTCEASLRRLQTDVIDLYYLHRWDKSVPIEESVGGLAELLREGKIRSIGLSEVSAATLKKAHAEHPIAAVQTEYSLWTRNPEIAVLEACRDIGVAFVAFSPLGRGFLGGAVRDGNFAPRDLRATMPRFMAENLAQNLTWFAEFEYLANSAAVTPAQLALAWVMSRGDHVHVIPGTTSIEHLTENMTVPELDASLLAEAGELINIYAVKGARYPATIQPEIDTEEFAP
ncbi:MAG: aldo/keto reductase [Asticcacaulis sp.]|uniref:aldo/keto reductase n=1 Tax=Asticcacaulis sp. TaxID=1872648 RepID=UPI0039E4AEC6